MIRKIRKVLEGIAERIIDKYKRQDRLNYLKTTKDKIHIAKGFKLLCGGSVYSYEEEDWEFTPYVEKYDLSEMKYATCEKCLEKRSSRKD